MQKSGCEPTVTGTLWHIHRGWLGHHLTSTHRRREEQGSMNREWLHTEVEFEILRHVFKAGSNGEAKRNKRVYVYKMGKQKNIYTVSAMFWNLVAITKSRFEQLFWPVFFCPMSFSRELPGLLWAFATRTWQRSPRCGHGGFPGWHQPAGKGATHWVQGWVFRQHGVQDPTGNKAEWYLYIYMYNYSCFCWLNLGRLGTKIVTCHKLCFFHVLGLAWLH